MVLELGQLEAKVGLSYFNTSLAKDNIRSMFDYMDDYGMVADCVYTR